MSVHIGAEAGQIAETVLLPGDPLRAQFVAEHLLTDAQTYNQVRGMLGFTGSWNGMRVSVQGTGMGMPSLAIYVNELIREYGVKRLIRIGSCGSLQKTLEPNDLVLAISASTDSAMNRLRFRGMEYAPTASGRLLAAAFELARERSVAIAAGNVLSADTFYNDDRDLWKLWAEYGVLAVEMETAQLYTLAAKHGVDALSVLTVSDSLVTGAELSAAERQTGFREMITFALDLCARDQAAVG